MDKKDRTKRRGMVQVYTGNGKGKTTAALGLAMRAAGQGRKVLVVQFMKGKTNYGELKSARKLGIIVRQFGRPDFVDKDDPHPEDFRGAQQALAFALESMRRRRCDVLILDELNVALCFKLVGLKQVMALIAQRPSAVELIITGRYAHRNVLAAADLVTEMREVRHYYAAGVTARKGIEF
ncbi:MAG: cob(I)yrinic acid a,c-diamide adenosyltransferase [Candidatus Edwardsbacteria bacterium]|nr:cob(I)yrinic acid a,c-diamide adenosyltransferase [Candidatus Edwardsbacteria bacterium]